MAREIPTPEEWAQEQLKHAPARSEAWARRVAQVYCLDLEAAPAPDETIRAYDQHAESWAAKRSGPGFWDQGFRWLQAEVPAGARIIEFGTGFGRDAAVLTALGYDYSGLDASQGMLTLARKALPGVPLWHMNLRAMSLPVGCAPFDGFWTAATLLHIPKAEIGVVLRNMRAMLRPDAAGFVAVKDGSGEEHVTTPDVPEPRFFAYWDAPGFRAALECAGYEILRYELRPDGRDGAPAWHQFLVRCTGKTGTGTGSHAVKHVR